MAILMLLGLPVAAVTGELPIFIAVMIAACLVLAFDQNPLRR
jgi:hypothetical protein